MEELVREFCSITTTAHAPINICLQETIPLPISDLVYENYDVLPIKMKVNNTGYTATVSAKFDSKGQTPTICGGALNSAYTFSQLHFHWGPDNSEGSEHTLECRRLPLEMHVVHINCRYPTQEEALLQKDGVVILAYWFIPGKRNEALQSVIDNLHHVQKPHTSHRISPMNLNSLVPRFTRDYFTYWGAVTSPSCSHLIQWLLCREPIDLSLDQLEPFRKLLNVNNEPLLRNFRDINPLCNRKVFHCAPGSRSGTAIQLSASRAAMLSTREPSEAGQPLMDVEEPCTSLEEADSRSKVSHPRSGPVTAKPSTTSLRERSHPASASEQEPSSTQPARSSPTSKPSTTSLRERSHRGSTSASQHEPSSIQPAEEAEDQALPTQPREKSESHVRLHHEEVQEDGWIRSVSRTASGTEHIRLHQHPTSSSAERTGCCRPLSRSPSGAELPRAPSRAYMSRGISFSDIAETKERTANEFPDEPYCGPALRSPIHINLKNASRMPLPPLDFQHHFDEGTGLALTNSGETVELNFLRCKEQPFLAGGPLQGRYMLDSAHFHWIPSDDMDGGTHTINNTRTEIELHLVHVREDFKSKTEAMECPNALAIVTFLLQVGGEECDAFAKISQDVHKIQELHSQLELPNSDLSWLRTAAKPYDYFVYPGRFFGRDEGQPVLWMVYAQPVGICCQNVAQFQRLNMSVDFKPHETYPLDERPLIAAVPMKRRSSAAAITAAGTGTAADTASGTASGAATGTGADAGSSSGQPITSRSALESGCIMTIPPDQWPNVPFKSPHPCLCAPLDIVTKEAQNLALPPLEFSGHFDRAVNMELRNTGETVNMKWRGVDPMPVLLGGPLLEEYVFDSAHFHWAQNPDDIGSMHRIDSRRFDLEFHMIHYRKSCGSRQEAIFKSDGLCVCTFLLQVGGEENADLANIADALPTIREVDRSTMMTASLAWARDRAAAHGYYLYPGTLFGADKGINVIWIVYPVPIPVCCQYIAQFYKLDCADKNRVHIIHDTMGRPIYLSRDPESCRG